ALVLLETLNQAEKPLSRNQLLKRSEIPSDWWGNSLGLLMMHDKIEILQGAQGEVYSCKRRPPDSRPDAGLKKDTVASQSKKTLPFFDFEDGLP
ncbi:MAG: hypothetical protein NTX50_03915, partial [Candidatus Sumerlaeota bacterium]|nr:hypothetical protein [Candidatus Sumerlaeota bacterium]